MTQTREELIQRILDRQTSAMNEGFDWPQENINNVPFAELEEFLEEIQLFLGEFDYEEYTDD